MQITRANYELFFLDYLEGNLAAGLEEEFRAFLAINPDLAEELQMLTDADPIQRGEEVFEAKSALKVPSEPRYSEDGTLLAAALEGDLTTEEQAGLNARLEAEQGLRNDWNVFQLTKPLPSDVASLDDRTRNDIRFPGELDWSDIRNLFVAELEGDITPSDRKRLEQAITEDPSLEKERLAFSKTRLIPTDKDALSTSEKQALYQKGVVRALPLRRYLSYAAAAAVAALFTWRVSVQDGGTATVASKHTPLLQDVARPAGNSVVTPHEQDGLANSSYADSSPGKVRRASQHTESDISAPAPASPTFGKLDLLEAGLLALDSKVMPDLQPDMSAIHTLPTNDPRHLGPAETQYYTIFEYAGMKAKDALWGSEDYPEENFAMALAQREFNRRLGNNRTNVELRREKNGEKTKTQLRIGKKFRIVRTR